MIRKRRCSGQGLAEALITFAIIAIGTVSLVTFQNNLAYHNSITQQRNDAITLATQKVEALHDFHVLNTQSGYTAYQDIVTGTSTSTGTSATYTLNWTITTNTNPNYKTIDVTVTWTDRRGTAQSVRMTSRIGKTDPSFSASVI